MHVHGILMVQIANMQASVADDVARFGVVCGSDQQESIEILSMSIHVFEDTCTCKASAAEAASPISAEGLQARLPRRGHVSMSTQLVIWRQEYEEKTNKQCKMHGRV